MLFRRYFRHKNGFELPRKKYLQNFPIVVSSKLVFSDKDKACAFESSLAAMRQAGCDISIEFSSTLGTAYTFDSDDITRYRNYTRAVYDAISGNSDLNETEFSVSFSVTLDELPENVFKIGLTAKTTRKNAKCDYDGIKSAECDILRAEDFKEKFEKAFPDILLAASGSSLYGIPRKAYLEEISILPYSIDTEPIVAEDKVVFICKNVKTVIYCIIKFAVKIKS